MLPLLKKLGLETTSVHTSIRTVDGTSHDIVRTVDIPFNLNGKFKVVQTLVARSIPKALILGMDFWEAFSIIPTMASNLENCFTVEDVETDLKNEVDDGTVAHQLNDLQQRQLKKVLGQFLVSTSETLGCTKVIKHSIDTGLVTGVKTRARPISPYVRKRS